MLIFSASTGIKYPLNTSDWKDVERHQFIPYDLEEYPIQIKTDSETGSGDIICLVVYNKEATDISQYNDIGWITILFSNPMKYLVGLCSETGYKANKEFQNPSPEEKNKIWTISKTSTHLVIQVNGVEVLNFEFATAPLLSCATQWGQDVTKIVFWSSDNSDDDTASDEYRKLRTINGKCMVGRKRVNACSPSSFIISNHA